MDFTTQWCLRGQRPYPPSRRHGHRAAFSSGRLQKRRCSRTGAGFPSAVPLSCNQRKCKPCCCARIAAFLIDGAANLSRKRGNQLKARPIFVRVLNAASVVGHCQTGLAKADASYQVHFDPAALCAERMLDAVHRGLIQDEANRQGPVDGQFEFVALDIDFDFLNLIADCAAQSPDVMGESDNLAFLTRSKLIMCQRDSVDAARHVVQSAVRFWIKIAALLNGDRR